MRTMFTAVAAICVLAAIAAFSIAADANNAPQTTITGVLIDQACGAKMVTKDNPEKAAEGHPKACAMKESCAASGYAVISGKEMIKFDENGDKLAKDFLQKTDKTKDLRVTVEGTREGDKIAVTSLTAAPVSSK